VCHCLAQAVLELWITLGTACSKQSHTAAQFSRVVRNTALAGLFRLKAVLRTSQSTVGGDLVLKQANAGGVRQGCFIEMSGDTVSSQR